VVEERTKIIPIPLIGNSSLRETRVEVGDLAYGEMDRDVGLCQGPVLTI